MTKIQIKMSSADFPHYQNVLKGMGYDVYVSPVYGFYQSVPVYISIVLNDNNELLVKTDIFRKEFEQMSFEEFLCKDRYKKIQKIREKIV